MQLVAFSHKSRYWETEAIYKEDQGRYEIVCARTDLGDVGGVSVASWYTPYLIEREDGRMFGVPVQFSTELERVCTNLVPLLIKKPELDEILTRVKIMT